MRNVEKDEEVFDETVMECYYNICRYYNNNKAIIHDYMRNKDVKKDVKVKLRICKI